MLTYSRENNEIARFANSNTSTPINPLYSIYTSNPIQGFPKTVKELNRLQETTVNSILRQLGQESNGSIESKLYLLKLLAGVKTGNGSVPLRLL
jgi:hypothetical protein